MESMLLMLMLQSIPAKGASEGKAIVHLHSLLFHRLTGPWECFALQDSGQPIPLVVESCIRYINLYGNLLFTSALLLTLKNF